MNPNAQSSAGTSLMFPTLSSTSSILFGNHGSGGVSGSSGGKPTSTGLVNQIHDRVDPSIHHGNDISELRAYIILVMEAIVYLGDIREPTTPENIYQIIAHALHEEAEISLADVHQALSIGSKKAIFTWSSKSANTWTIDSKNIDGYKDNHEFVGFYQSLAVDTKSRLEKIKKLFDATKRKINPIVAYSQTFQDGGKNSEVNAEQGLLFSELGLKDDVFDPASDPGNYISYHQNACLTPSSIHYAARKITIKLLQNQSNMSSEDQSETISALEKLIKGHKIFATTSKQQKPSQIISGPQWSSNKFAFDNIRATGKKPGFLSGFSVVARKQ